MTTTVSPLVSVVIPTYNRRALVQLTVASALQQTYPAVEVIVVDDGSTDGTKAALKEAYGDRITYIWQENQGESVARNCGLAAARGKYIALLDSDDLWLPEKLERQVFLLAGSPHLNVVACEAWLIDREGDRLNLPPLGHALAPEHYSLEKLLLANTFANGSTALMRCDLLREIGGFDPQIRYGEDWDLWLRMRARGEFAIIPEPLACVRRHTETQSHVPRKEIVESRLIDHVRLLEKAFASLPPGKTHLAALRPSSLAQQYADAACAAYAWGQAEQAKLWLTQAWGLDFDAWSQSDRLLTRLADYAVGVFLLEASFTTERVREYIVAVRRGWPGHTEMPRGFCHRLQAKLHLELGYQAYLAQHYQLARRHMLSAIRNQPTLMRDLGLVRRLMISLVVR